MSLVVVSGGVIEEFEIPANPLVPPPPPPRYTIKVALARKYWYWKVYDGTAEVLSSAQFSNKTVCVDSLIATATAFEKHDYTITGL